MTKAELHHRIATSIEPKPGESGDWYKTGPLMFDERMDSIGKVWFQREFYKGLWQPRDFSTDPEMTLLLLKELKCQVLYSGWPHSFGSGKDGPMGWIVSKGVLYSVCDESLELAVRNAYALAHKLATGEELEAL